MLTLPDRVSAVIARDPVSITPRVEWSYDWENWYPLRVVSGSHTQDRSQQTRWSFTGTFVKDYPVKVDAQSIHPYGCRARIFLGISTLRSSTYWVPAGRYTITAANENDDETTIALTGASFETDVIDNQFVTTRNVPDRGGSSYRQQAEKLILESVPDATFSWDPRLMASANSLLPAAALTSDRWGFIDGPKTAPSIAGALGAEAYCDSSGQFIFRPVPTLADAPVWSVARGGVLSSRLRGYDRTSVANLVAVSGDSTDGSTTIGPAYAWDDDPRSVTYAGPDPVNQPGVGVSHFGIKPVAYTNSLIANGYQAGIAARAQLADYLGAHYTVTFNSRFNPASEAGDVIEVEVNPGVWEKHLLDSLAYTWASATVACTTRSPKEDIAS